MEVWRVSIPHRLATNHLEVHKAYREGLFQFLIGWLQTDIHFKIMKFKIKFQFLIGWLQTYIDIYVVMWKKVVSIPHRLATNRTNSA